MNEQLIPVCEGPAPSCRAEGDPQGGPSECLFEPSVRDELLHYPKALKAA